MDLDKIQEMWQKDSVIDPDNLHDESLKIPNFTPSIIQFTIHSHFSEKRQETLIGR